MKRGQARGLAASVLACLGTVAAATVTSAGAAGPGTSLPPLPRPPSGHADLDGPLSAIDAAPPARRKAIARRTGVVLRHDLASVEVLTVIRRTDAAADRLRAAGARTPTVAPGIIEARVPVAALAPLSRDPSIRYIRTLIPPAPASITGGGVSDSRANAAHRLGVTGAGVKVMVMDVGFSGRAASQASGDLPAGLDVDNHCSNIDGSEHGTNVAEIVHEMAPGAALVLSCTDSYADTVPAEQYAVTHGVDVISRSLGDNNQTRGDGSGGPATTDGLARDALSHGILWVNSAGNAARSHWSGVFPDPESDDFLNWHGSNARNQVVIGSGQQQCFFLKWDDWPVSSIDYNLFLRRVSDDALVGSSAGPQTGTQPPTEAFCYTNPGVTQSFYLYVVRSPGEPARRVDVFGPQTFSFQFAVAAGSLDESAGEPAVLSVGAVCPFDHSLQGYSSQGPTIDGKVRPDLAGPAPVSTRLDSPTTDCFPSGFGGTSAAAPHVSGAAALYKQALGLGPNGLHSILDRTTLDLGARGTDNQFGTGLLQVELGPCDGRRATIVGTHGADTLSGTPGDDVIIGLAGNDRIDGGGGVDRVCGGAGRDTLLGRGGGDRLFGEAGADALRGGPGRDRLVGGPGPDRLVGGPGRDRLRGGPGRDRQTQ